MNSQVWINKKQNEIFEKIFDQYLQNIIIWIIPQEISLLKFGCLKEGKIKQIRAVLKIENNNNNNDNKHARAKTREITQPKS